MTQDGFAPLTVPGLLDLLEAVVEALDLPGPGSAEACRTRERLLSERADQVRTAAAWVLEDQAAAGSAAAWLRKRLGATHYLTVDQVYEARVTGTVVI